MNKGDLVLVPFPFTDLSQTKLRPAIVLWADPNGQDVTLCFVTSQDVSQIYPGEFVLDPVDPEFQQTGLKVISKVRVTRIVTLERRLLARRLGKLSAKQLKQLDDALVQAFQLSPNP
ncbi:MAG TPA: type II toxin-antitoxin system PemK/MazF family toxin [Leptolyngbyaceae cyanobacterium M33_DOE_097]|uniref:Type II toxin-antitoxin system PemK/MazF family toxin n=1 Tax=Oscillatoriales cyanobacterium SpSt-418 TaxID=2282169 RepID=A0A7C3KHL5_9CYAN|nr:type II toxin-antitoxin system PemK/MazF family toxin [Leptolyngbyaceae cyanobacterium M33_DOE_097]